jgi:hypothetical protein
VEEEEIIRGNEPNWGTIYCSREEDRKKTVYARVLRKKQGGKDGIAER